MTTQEDFSAAYHKYFEPIYRYVYFRTRHTQDTEDIVSTVFEKVYAKFSNYHTQEGATIKSWIFRIAHNAVVDYYRSKKETISIEEFETPVESSQERETTLLLETHRVKQIMQQLSERKRDVLSLRYEAQLTYEEIGNILDIETKSASSIASRALNEVRDAYNTLYEYESL